ncbi:MAG: fluoride efflux transporter CrcB [Arcobacter sp.]|jgi:CrcB protein|nr:fluoride efflux transporter CrcB [Arcobacter sp.]
MKQFLLVFLGGGLGSLLRYIISRTFNTYFQHFYLGTFLVNIIGCLIIGLVLGISYKSNLLSQNQTLLLTTGFCGGFTTFSTFALENQTLLKSGEILHFSFYTIASIAVGIFAVILGLWLSKLM